MKEGEQMKTLLRLEVILAAMLVAMFVTVLSRASTTDPPKVDGVWDITVETPNGTGTPTLTLKQDGENLTGTYKGRYGESSVKGTIKGTDIQFTVTINVQGQDLQIEYTGTVDGDTMKGKAKFGEFGEGNFTAKKKAAPAA